MDKFKEREHAFENKFVHDQEIEFKISARAYKLTGLWAAKAMGLNNEQAFDYAMGLVENNITRKFDPKELAHKLIHDFATRNIKKPLAEVHAEIIACRQSANDQIMTE